MKVTWALKRDLALILLISTTSFLLPLLFFSATNIGVTNVDVYSLDSDFINNFR